MFQNNEDVPLFDMTVFDKLDLSKFKSLFKPPIDIKDPGSGLVVRPLRASDYNTGTVCLTQTVR